MNQAWPTPKPVKTAPGIIFKNLALMSMLSVVYAKESEHRFSGCSSLNCPE